MMDPNLIYKLVHAYEEEGYTVLVGTSYDKNSVRGLLCYLKKVKPESTFPFYNKNNLKEFIYNYNLQYPNYISIIPFLRYKIKIFINNLFFIIKSFLSRKKLHDNDSINPLLSTGGGISIQEIYFLDCLLSLLKPKTIYKIGVAFGWSTIAIGLISPNSKIIAIDNCTEGIEASEGLKITQKISEKLGINTSIIVGTSPQDIPQTLKNNVLIDFVFIDGLHTNDQVVKDFKGILPFCSSSVVIAFHDVIHWNMLSGWEEIMTIANKNGFEGSILRRTTTGMGILYRNVDQNVINCIRGFYQDF